VQCTKGTALRLQDGLRRAWGARENINIILGSDTHADPAAPQ